MEYAVYKIMKARHGDLFPMWVNGKVYRTKWVCRVEEQIEKENNE